MLLIPRKIRNITQLPRAVLRRTASAAALLLWCTSIAPYVGAIRVADVLVTGAHIQAVLLSACLFLRRLLGLFGACLVRVESSV